MSADNAYFVIRKHTEDGYEFSVAHGFMSPFCEQEEFAEQYGGPDGYTRSLFGRGRKFTVRGEALEYAHDCCKEEYIVEYGVVEVNLDS